MGVSKGVGLAGGADDEARAVREFGEVFEAVGVEWEVIRNGYIW